MIRILIILFILICQPLAVFAGDDPDQGMSRAWNIEEPWIENAYYFYASRDNDASSGHALNANVERDMAFSRQWGAEIDAPGLMATDPLGKGTVAPGPTNLGIKYAPWQWGDAGTDSAGVIDMELEGGWWAKPKPLSFPGVGSNITGQVLIGLRRSSRWFQGQYAITRRLGADARNGWSANSAIGQRFTDIWSIQMELDINHTSVNNSGATRLGITWTPQISAQIGHEWVMLIGESFARIGGQAGYTSTTNVLFEYRFDNDKEDADNA